MEVAAMVDRPVAVVRAMVEVVDLKPHRLLAVNSHLVELHQLESALHPPLADTHQADRLLQTSANANSDLTTSAQLDPLVQKVCPASTVAMPSTDWMVFPVLTLKMLAPKLNQIPLA
jgi:hypothetical protein